MKTPKTIPTPAPAGNETPRYISPRRIRQVIGISRSTALRLEADPLSDFPRRIRISKGRTAWIASELFDWIKARPRVEHEHC